MKVSEKVKQYVGSINRGNVQRAIQSCLLQQDVDPALFRQLASLDVALEVEQTALLHIDDKARNFNNPARLAATYTSVRELLKADVQEVKQSNDGWNDLLDNLEGTSATEPGHQLKAVQPETDGLTPTGYDEGSGNGEGKGFPFILTPPQSTARHRLDTLTRRRIEIALRAPRPNKAEIARTIGVSRSTVDRISKQMIADDGPPAPE